MAKGFRCLAAIMDLASRKVLFWRLSNSLDTPFCIEQPSGKKNPVRFGGLVDHIQQVESDE
jgi:hypothetical protein